MPSGQATLAPWLPAGLELDLYDGRCYVSLVGFLFANTQAEGVFASLSIRGSKRLICASTFVASRRTVHRIAASCHSSVNLCRCAAISIIANTLYEEPYATLPTRCSIIGTSQSLSVRYDWRHRKVWQSVTVRRPWPFAQPIEAGSEEEVYYRALLGLYTRRRDGSTSAYEVRHPRWEVYPVLHYEIVADFGALYGPEFAGLNGQQPASILLAEGSEV